MDAIAIPIKDFGETGHRFIGPATEQKVPRLIGPGLLPQQRRQPGRRFGQQMAEVMEIEAGEKNNRWELPLQPPDGIREGPRAIKPAGPMQRTPPTERLNQRLTLAIMQTAGTRNNTRIVVVNPAQRKPDQISG